MPYNLNKNSQAAPTIGNFIVDGLGIKVDKLKSQYVISVDTDFTPRYIDAINNSVNQLESKLGKLNTKVGTLATQLDLNGLSSKVSEIKSNLDKATEDISSVKANINDLDISIDTIEESIAPIPKIQEDIENLKIADRDLDRLQIDKFIGSIINPLSKTLKQVLSVTYCGITLNPLSYSISNNILYLHVERHGIEVDVNDTIYITYTYTQI